MLKLHKTFISNWGLSLSIIYLEYSAFFFKVVNRESLCMISKRKAVVTLILKRIKIKAVNKQTNPSSFRQSFWNSESWHSHSRSFPSHLDCGQWPGTITNLWTSKFLHMLHICLHHPFLLWVGEPLKSNYLKHSRFYHKAWPYFFLFESHLSSESSSESHLFYNSQ